jgi:predicted nucleotidyltransferase
MTLMPSRPRDLVLARDALSRLSEVRLAIAFGSVARGEALDDSDVDIAVSVKSGTSLLELGRVLSLAVGREAHIVSLDDVTIPLLEELVGDGVVVHEAEQGIAAQWRSQALCTLEIDGPWYARMRDAWLRRVAERGLPDGQPSRRRCERFGARAAHRTASTRALAVLSHKRPVLFHALRLPTSTHCPRVQL